MTETSRGLAVLEGDYRVVKPIGTADDAVREWNEYQQLVHKLLNPTDYQEVRQGGKLVRFKKKSAWRKLAVRFSVSVEITKTVIGHKHNKETCARVLIPGELECGCPTQYARIEVRATHPTGRHTDGIGICSLGEKNRVFSKPDHEIPATAYTRAANRAIADMIGAGEDSAEEAVTPGEGTEPDTRVTPQDLVDLARAWQKAEPDRKGALLALFESYGYTGDRKAVFAAFQQRGTVQQLEAAMPVLTGSSEPEGFDPDAVPPPPTTPEGVE